MGQTVTLKQGDLLPDVSIPNAPPAGGSANIVGALVTFSMRPSRAPGTPTINDALATVSGANLVYNWLSGDTASPGTYEAQFHVQPASGAPYQVPTDGYITVIIEGRIGT